MCLILFAHRVSEDFPLVLAANRDEFHARPTAPAAFWHDHPDLLAGRDLQAGGTWMGITRQGRFAAITNFRDPQRTAPAPRSRGELTVNFLVGTASPETYLHEITPHASDYAGFNLLLGDGESLWYFSNSTADELPRALSPGTYGLSNASLDTPWPKVQLGKQRLQSVITETPDHAGLATVVSDRGLASPRELRGHGLRGEMDQLLSAQFIVNPTYGTRATTTIWQQAGGGFAWREVSFSAQGEPVGAVEEQLPGR